MGRAAQPEGQYRTPSPAKSQPRAVLRDTSQSVPAEPSGSPKEIVAGISHEILELSEKLKKSPVIDANRGSVTILEAMSKFSLPHQVPLECYSPSDSNPYMSLRELHTGRCRVEMSAYVPVSPTAGALVGLGLNANFREAGAGPKTSKVFNVASVPCIAAASSFSEGSASGAGGTTSDHSSDFFTSSHVCQTHACMPLGRRQAGVHDPSLLRHLSRLLLVD